MHDISLRINNNTDDWRQKHTHKNSRYVYQEFFMKAGCVVLPTMSWDTSSMLWDSELLRSADEPPSVPGAGLPRLPAGLLFGRMDSTPDSGKHNANVTRQLPA